MRLILYLLMFAVGLLVGPTDVYAIPPPVPNPDRVVARARLDELGPFVGSWEVEEMVPGLQGPELRHILWNVGRLGDQLTLTERGGAIPKVYSISFDPASENFRIFLLGYRGNILSPEDAVVVLEHPDQATISWQEPYISPIKSGARLKYTMSIRDGKWFQKIDYIDEYGAAKVMEQATLERRGPPSPIIFQADGH